MYHNHHLHETKHLKEANLLQEEKYRHYLDLFAIDENKRVDQLSSGMRVKYLLALALSHNARLLILDVK